MQKKKTAKRKAWRGKLTKAIALCGIVFGALNGALSFVQNVPKVADQLTTAVYGPPVTFGEIESLRVKPQW